MQDRSDEMTTVETNWRQEVVWICGPRKERSTRESWFADGAKKCGVKWRQLKALYHGEVKDPKVSVGDKVRWAAEQARQEAQALASRFETIAGSLNAKDEDFHSADVAALIDAARALRGLDRAGDSK